MQLQIERESLQKNLELVGKVSTKHVTLPVLQCVLIVVADKKVTLTATNLEIGIKAVVEGTINEETTIAVPASTLLQTISLLTDKTITLSHEGDVLVVEGKKSKTNIKTLPFDEFPTIPVLETKGQVLNRKLFSLGIKSTAFACSQSSIKPELGSINVHQKKEHSLTFVATDSFRLMEKTVPQKGVVLDEPLLLPQKNALELARVCESIEIEPQLHVNENQCALSFNESLYITSRLTTGSFPDYEQIIPKEYSSHVTILKQDLIQAFKRSQVFLNKFQQVTLHITKDDLTISTNNGELGTTTESIKASTEGDDITLNFNQRYISEALQYFNDDSIILSFTGIGRPMVINGVNDTTTRYLVMTMNK